MKRKCVELRCIMAIIPMTALIFVVSCAPKTRIRASDTMFTENQVEKIAVFTEGKINWPRMGRGGPGLGVSDSKTAVEKHLSMTEQILSKKGYEVVYAKSVGIGYYCNKWWLMPEAYGEDETVQLQQIVDWKPKFIYPEFQDNDELDRAVQNLIRQVEEAITQKRLYSFTPALEDIEIIRQATQADTICLNRVYGVKYSTRRKAGVFALGVLAAMFGSYGHSSLSDMVESFYLFIDAKTGDVLWERGMYVKGNPVEPKEEFLEGVLRFFPDRNESFDPDSCAKGKDGFVYCK